MGTLGEAGYTDTRVELMKNDKREEKVKMGRVEGKVSYMR